MDRKLNTNSKHRPKIVPFEEFLSETMKDDTISEKYVIGRRKWIVNEAKAKQILDKIPSDELPKCEQIDADHSKVGDFIDRDTFTDVYDENGEIIDGLGVGGLLCFCWNSSMTWWKRRKGENGDGLVRVK